MNAIYPPDLVKEIGTLTDLLPGHLDENTWRVDRGLLHDVELIFSGWGMAVMDESFLNAVPRLRHVFYGAGSVRSFYTKEAIGRGITVSSAWRANAIPVAEFTHAQIILSLKNFWQIQQFYTQTHNGDYRLDIPGTYQSTVGLVSLGAIGRMVARLLQQNDLKVIAHDPYVDPLEASTLGVDLVSLDTLFQNADVISLHTPNLPTTQGMINHELLTSMKPGATLINTARGNIIDESALVAVWHDRPDLMALLDVTAQEPFSRRDQLWKLPNVILTPHIAGSKQRECKRLGQAMVDELKRYLAGMPLEHKVEEDLLKTMA